MFTGPKSSGDGCALSVAARIVTVNGAVPAQPTASVAWTVNVNVDATVGIPDTTPPLETVRPVGGVPSGTVNVYGGAPPLAMSVCEYGEPSSPVVRLPPIDNRRTRR